MAKGRSSQKAQEGGGGRRGSNGDDNGSNASNSTQHSTYRLVDGVVGHDLVDRVAGVGGVVELARVGLDVKVCDHGNGKSRREL